MRIVLATAIFASLGALAQTPESAISQQPLKTLAGDDTTLALPAGRGAILVLGFTRESNAPARDWAEQLRVAFEDSPENAPTPAVLSLVVLDEVPRLFRGMIRRGIRAAIPDTLQNTFYIVESNGDYWRKLASFSAEDDAESAYVLRVDENGRICARRVGTVSGDALAKLVEADCAT